MLLLFGACKKRDYFLFLLLERFNVKKKKRVLGTKISNTRYFLTSRHPRTRLQTALTNNYVCHYEINF